MMYGLILILVFSIWDSTCMVMDRPPKDRIKDENIALCNGLMLSRAKSLSPIVISSSDLIIILW